MKTVLTGVAYGAMGIGAWLFLACIVAFAWHLWAQSVRRRSYQAAQAVERARAAHPQPPYTQQEADDDMYGVAASVTEYNAELRAADWALWTDEYARYKAEQRKQEKRGR